MSIVIPTGTQLIGAAGNFQTLVGFINGEGLGLCSSSIIEASGLMASEAMSNARLSRSESSQREYVIMIEHELLRVKVLCENFLYKPINIAYSSVRYAALQRHNHIGALACMNISIINVWKKEYEIARLYALQVCKIMSAGDGTSILAQTTEDPNATGIQKQAAGIAVIAAGAAMIFNPVNWIGEAKLIKQGLYVQAQDVKDFASKIEALITTSREHDKANDLPQLRTM
jgi:hypothetical protein